MSAERQGCVFCGGIIEPKLITYCRLLDGIAYLVNDVPADVCTQCGEQYYPVDVVYSLNQILKQGTPVEYRQAPVYRFAHVERPDRPAAAKSRQNSA